MTKKRTAPVESVEAAVEEVADTVAVQPTLPDLELPDYHGLKAVGMATGLSGAGARITKPHAIRDRVVFVVEGKVADAGHRDTDRGLIYHETIKVLDLFEVSGDQGSRLLSTLRSLYRTAEDAVKGRRPVDGLGDVGYTDAAGVVLTPAEVAELRGDPVRAILSPNLTPAVVVYGTGQRDLWPDEFPRDTPRPRVGDVFVDDSGDLTVTELLHHETGEPIEEESTVAERLAVTIDGSPATVGDLVDVINGAAASSDDTGDDWEFPAKADTEEVID